MLLADTSPRSDMMSLDASRHLGELAFMPNAGTITSATEGGVHVVWRASTSITWPSLNSGDRLDTECHSASQIGATGSLGSGFLGKR